MLTEEQIKLIKKLVNDYSTFDVDTGVQITDWGVNEVNKAILSFALLTELNKTIDDGEETDQDRGHKTD